MDQAGLQALELEEETMQNAVADELGYAVHSYSLMSVDFQSGHPPGSGSN